MKHSQTGIAGKLLFLMAGLLFAFTVKAQTITVSGVVSDPSGEPLIGASILAEGTSVGTATDIDGAYTLNVAPTATLVFSYVGYDVQRVAVDGRTSINVTMTENSVMLNEVVAIGYGVVKKSDATGSVAVIKPDEIEAGLATSVQDMLVGQTPGVVVTPSGGPEGNAQIRIRGEASLSANNDPLIVVDGVPIDNNGVQGMGNAFSMIAPDNIESMTVLKDASATAIYGSRASNGVIIITTKKGQAGKPQINFSANMYVNTPRKTYKTMSTDLFRQIVMERSAEGSDNRALLGNADTDWQDEVLRTTVSSDYNLSVGGTAGILPYRVSIGYTNSNGIIKTSKMDRVTMGINLTPKFFQDHLSVQANVKGYYFRNQFGNESAVFEAISYNPTQPVYSNVPIVGGNSGFAYLWNGYYQHSQSNNKQGQDGTSFLNNADINPVSNLMERDNYANVYRSNGNLQLDYSFHFLPELHANLNLGYDVSKTNEANIVDANSGISWKNGHEQFGGGYRKDTYQFKSNTLLDFYLNYKKEFDAIRSGLDVTAGYSWQRFYEENHNAGDVPTTGELYFPVAADGGYVLNWVPGTEANIGEPFVPSELSEDGIYYYKEHLQLLSFFGRLNYTFMDRYLLTFTIRGDATSRFSEDNRWGVFPSVALAWKINDESWMKGASGWLSDLKLRLGWGKTGQQAVGSVNNYTLVYDQSQGTVLYPNGLNGYYNPYNPNGESYNPDLKWETTTTWNGGFDYGFLNNRITGSIEAYYRKTTDLLSWVAVPAGSSTTNYMNRNIGDLENLGIEFNISAKPIVTNDFTWTVNYNVAWNKNKITKLNNDDAVYGTGDGVGPGGQQVMANAVGHPASSFYLYQQVYDEAGNPIEGVYVDQDGNGIIDSNDRVFIGHSKDPKVTMTFGSQFRYKQWDFGFTLRASLGNYLYNNVEAANSNYSRLFQYGLHNLVEADNYFESEQKFSDYYVRNASFLRCDNITLGYTWDNLLNDNLRLRLFAGVQNPFVITKYSGTDPEFSGGIENSPYPKATTYSLGLVATF